MITMRKPMVKIDIVVIKVKEKKIEVKVKKGKVLKEKVNVLGDIRYMAKG